MAGVKQAVAVILGIQLGGVNYYKGIVSDRARMGQPFEALKAVHIKKTIVIMNSGVLLFALFLWIGGITMTLPLMVLTQNMFIRQQAPNSTTTNRF